jgi:hypothetical protein
VLHVTAAMIYLINPCPLNQVKKVCSCLVLCNWSIFRHCWFFLEICIQISADPATKQFSTIPCPYAPQSPIYYSHSCHPTIKPVLNVRSGAFLVTEYNKVLLAINQAKWLNSEKTNVLKTISVLVLRVLIWIWLGTQSVLFIPVQAPRSWLTTNQWGLMGGVKWLLCLDQLSGWTTSWLQGSRPSSVWSHHPC